MCVHVLIHSISEPCHVGMHASFYTHEISKCSHMSACLHGFTVTQFPNALICQHVCMVSHICNLPVLSGQCVFMFLQICNLSALKCQHMCMISHAYNFVPFCCCFGPISGGCLSAYLKCSPTLFFKRLLTYENAKSYTKICIK